MNLREAPRPATPVANGAAATAGARLEAVGVVELAAQARNVSDWIAGQVGATREYERRIEQLEAELAASQASLLETKTQLAGVLQLLDVLRPSV